MEREKPNHKNDQRFSRIRVTSIFTFIRRYKLAAILLAVIRILVLLMDAYFNSNRDQEKARAKVKEAQDRLDAIAATFELRVRYPDTSPAELDRLEDLMTPAPNQKEGVFMVVVVCPVPAALTV